MEDIKYYFKKLDEIMIPAKQSFLIVLKIHIVELFYIKLYILYNKKAHVVKFISELAHRYILLFHTMIFNT